MTITVRLPEKIEGKLEKISKMKKKTKYYFEKSPFELGEAFFGKYQSGSKDLSINSKKAVKQRILTKFHAKKPD